MPNNVSVDELKAKAKELRLHIAQTTFNATSGHIGGSLSCTDMLIALYFKYLNIDPANPDWDERDRFILSKGHCALAYVPCLAMRGFLNIDEVMKNFNKTESAYGMHPDSKKIRGCDASTGSLGHGLPMGVGMALGLRMKGYDSKIVVMTGDGECQEGSNWEAAMSASHFKLKNLIWIIDRNHFEIDGETETVMALEPLDEKVKAFGFKVIKCNGNKMAECDKALAEVRATEGPACIISDPVTRYGIDKYEGKAISHYGSFGADEKELQVYLDEINSREF